VPPGVDLLQPIEREVVAVFGNEHMGQQTGRRETAVLEPGGQQLGRGGLHRCGFEDFFGDRKMFEEARGAFLRRADGRCGCGLRSGKSKNQNFRHGEQQLQLVRRKPFDRRTQGVMDGSSRS